MVSTAPLSQRTRRRTRHCTESQQIAGSAFCPVRAPASASHTRLLVSGSESVPGADCRHLDSERREPLSPRTQSQLHRAIVKGSIPSHPCAKVEFRVILITQRPTEASPGRPETRSESERGPPPAVTGEQHCRGLSPCVEPFCGTKFNPVRGSESLPVCGMQTESPASRAPAPQACQVEL